MNRLHNFKSLHEVQAQEKLLRIGKKEGWSKNEMDEIRRAKSTWEKRLKAE